MYKKGFLNFKSNLPIEDLDMNIDLIMLMVSILN